MKAFRLLRGEETERRLRIESPLLYERLRRLKRKQGETTRETKFRVYAIIYTLEILEVPLIKTLISLEVCNLVR